MTEPYDPPMAKTVAIDWSGEGKARVLVDGEPFPWWIDDNGISAKRIKADLCLVRVRILVVGAGDDDLPETFYHEGPGGAYASAFTYPVIQGIRFPWLISSDGFIYSHRGSRSLPTLEVEFFAESVEGIHVEDDAKVFDANGYFRLRLDPVTIRHHESDGGNVDGISKDIEAKQRLRLAVMRYGGRK